jgi:hypothetical protein
MLRLALFGIISLFWYIMLSLQFSDQQVFSFQIAGPGLKKNSPSTYAQTCAFYAKIGEKNFGNCCKGLCGKEIIFLFFWRIAR